jgi:hypothetical protein
MSKLYAGLLFILLSVFGTSAFADSVSIVTFSNPSNFSVSSSNGPLPSVSPNDIGGGPFYQQPVLNTTGDSSLYSGGMLSWSGYMFAAAGYRRAATS